MSTKVYPMLSSENIYFYATSWSRAREVYPEPMHLGGYMYLYQDDRTFGTSEYRLTGYKHTVTRIVKGVYRLTDEIIY